MSEFSNEKLTACLAVKIECSDAGDNITIREYLMRLLSVLWDEEEGFSGKRPFGNSGWKYELYLPLVKTRKVRGHIDEDGELTSVDTNAADELVQAMISYMANEGRP